MYLANAFSLNMMPTERDTLLKVRPLSVEAAVELARAREATGELTSVVGHPDTANIYANVLGVPVPVNRVTLTLNEGDELLVGQYRGPRLAPGTTELPEGATIQWFLVEVM